MTRYRNVNEQKAPLIVELTGQEVGFGEDAEIDDEIGQQLNPTQWEAATKPKKREESK